MRTLLKVDSFKCPLLRIWTQAVESVASRGLTWDFMDFSLPFLLVHGVLQAAHYGPHSFLQGASRLPGWIQKGRTLSPSARADLAAWATGHSATHLHPWASDYAGEAHTRHTQLSGWLILGMIRGGFRHTSGSRITQSCWVTATVSHRPNAMALQTSCPEQNPQKKRVRSAGSKTGRGREWRKGSKEKEN